MTVQPFDYNGAEVRTVAVDGEPWFVLADLCRVLDISNPSNVAGRLDPASVDTLRLAEGNRGNPNVTIVSEAGMYEVVIRSDKPEAAAFRRWLTTEVLPAIRKHGGYLTPEMAERVLTDPDTLIRLATDLKAEREKRALAEQRALALEPGAAAWDILAGSSGDYAVADAAKILSRDPSITIGRDRLFADMHERGWLYRQQGARGGWRAMQSQVDLGRLAERTGFAFQNSRTGELEMACPTVRITPKGLAALHRLLGGTGPLLLEVAS